MDATIGRKRSETNPSDRTSDATRSDEAIESEDQPSRRSSGRRRQQAIMAGDAAEATQPGERRSHEGTQQYRRAGQLAQESTQAIAGDPIEATISAQRRQLYQPLSYSICPYYYY